MMTVGRCSIAGVNLYNWFAALIRRAVSGHIGRNERGEGMVTAGMAFCVMAGLVPAIPIRWITPCQSVEIAGTSPAMT
jgi:hypothetical protein